jgi:rhodanese-related sulfurtransferase
MSRKHIFFALLVAVILAPLVAQPAPGKISPKAARELLANEKSAILIDVRTKEEFQQGRIAGSILLPYDQITAASAAKVIGTDRNRTVVLYCRSGNRSAVAASTLRSLGFTRVYDLGGINSWPYGIVK